MQISHYMTDDHRACDELFSRAEAAAAGGAAAASSFEDFAEDLERHFQIEESVLFPRLESATGSAGGPTQIMRNEHMQMRALVEDMRLSLQGGDTERYLDRSETLLVMMQQHNMKEEQILYPMADQVLASEAEHLLSQIRGR